MEATKSKHVFLREEWKAMGMWVIVNKTCIDYKLCEQLCLNVSILVI